MMTDVDKLLEGISTLVRSEFERRWIAYSGEIYNDYEFAELARTCNGKESSIDVGESL